MQLNVVNKELQNFQTFRFIIYTLVFYEFCDYVLTYQFDFDCIFYVYIL